jgi:hypothetical protein
MAQMEACHPIGQAYFRGILHLSHNQAVLHMVKRASILAIISASTE